MANLSKTYVIGTHVMWFEIEMYSDFIDGMINLLQTVENKENVTIDLCLNLLQHFEEVDTDKIKKHEIVIKFKRGIAKLEELGYWVNFQIKDGDEFYFHADYRRDLNYNYCKKVDYVMWGETDSFFPREAFQVIESLAKYTDEQNIHRYLLSFSDRKMWDASWDPLVHNDYVNLQFIDDDKGHLNPNQAKSPMSIEKMNEINSKAEEFDFSYIQHPKISGACLVLSSDLIKSGVNIPPCLLYNDDEGLSIMSHKLLGDKYIQFVVKNVLKVHNRNHPNKRRYVKGEDQSKNTHFKRNSVNWYKKFNEISKGNLSKLFFSQDRFSTYKDFKNEIDK